MTDRESAENTPNPDDPRRYGPSEDPVPRALICPLCSDRISGETTTERAAALRAHLQVHHT